MIRKLLKNLLGNDFTESNERYAKINFTIIFLSFYLCYLFWYVVERLQLINHLNISSPLFSFIVSLPIGTLMLIYKIIDSMFYNKRIKDILTMPINRKHKC